MLEQKRAGWRNPRHPREWLSSLRRFAFPRIGKMPVSEVTSADVLEILTPIWHRKAPTARRVRQRLRAVLEWAVAMEYRIDNPCDRIGQGHPTLTKHDNEMQQWWGFGVFTGFLASDAACLGWGVNQWTRQRSSRSGRKGIL